MGQSYKIVTTNLGRTAVRFALAQGTSVKLTHMAVGDGGGQDVEPMSSMTGLVRETFRAQINEITFDAVHPDMFTAELFIPQSVGGFYIREVGLFMETAPSSPSARCRLPKSPISAPAQPPIF